MLKAAIRKAIHATGYTVQRRQSPRVDPIWATLSDEERATWEVVQPYTMTSLERVLALIDATRYIEARGVTGAIVECGVWRGGSMMAVARTLLAGGSPHRELFLFDTFEGMPDPAEGQQDWQGRDARALLHAASDDDAVRAKAGLENVRTNLASTKYPVDRMHFVQGKVEETIPAHAPERIALLRLDTDWYESTYHELVHLVPRLAEGGVLIIDDYGHWTGARKAVDQYFRESGQPLLLHRIDYTGRMAVKTYRE